METRPITQPASPKKFPVAAVLISVLLTAVIVGGGIYWWQMTIINANQQQIDDLQNRLAQSETAETTVPAVGTSQPEIYTNSAYGFSLTFPISWGKISAQNVADTGSSKMGGIRLSSETDPDHRYIQINIARIEDKNSPEIVDAPQTFIKDSNLWSFYYISGGDCAGMPGCEGQEPEDILVEARQIIQTFTLAAAQTTTVKPTVTSPRSGETLGKAFGGVRIVGKAAPNSYVWLFQVSEMDPNCLSMASALVGANRVDANGNFEIIYAPYGEAENWPSEFAVVSIDPNQKYKLSWLNNTFCAPNEAKSDYFQLILKP